MKIEKSFLFIYFLFILNKADENFKSHIFDWLNLILTKKNKRLFFFPIFL